VPIADVKLLVINVCDDILIFLIPSKFNGYNAVNVYNGISADTYDVFKLNPNILPIEYVLFVNIVNVLLWLNFNTPVTILIVIK
jgi:hypothetical protein